MTTSILTLIVTVLYSVMLSVVLLDIISALICKKPIILSVIVPIVFMLSGTAPNEIHVENGIDAHP